MYEDTQASSINETGFQDAEVFGVSAGSSMDG